MEAGGEKMIYQRNGDLNVITRQTKEFKRVGEILKMFESAKSNTSSQSFKLFGFQIFRF
jgi:uncharacterized FAD-dependent dehydrogenase